MNIALKSDAIFCLLFSYKFGRRFYFYSANYVSSFCAKIITNTSCRMFDGVSTDHWIPCLFGTCISVIGSWCFFWKVMGGMDKY